MKVSNIIVLSIQGLYFFNICYASEQSAHIMIAKNTQEVMDFVTVTETLGSVWR